MEIIPSSSASAPPASFLQVAFFNQRGLRAGWRLLIFCGMLYAVFSGFSQLVRYLQSLQKHAGPAVPMENSYVLPVAQGLFEFVTFLLLLLLSWIMSRIERRKVGEYGLPIAQAEPARLLASGLLLGFLLLFITLAALRGLHAFYFGNLGLHGPQILVWGFFWGFTFLGVGFFEEFLFRGYALYTLADGIGFWPAAIIMGLVFGRAHMGNGGETYIGIFGTVLFAVLASAMLRRTGSLWLPVGVHAGWDWGQSYFFGVSDSGFQAPGHLLNPHIQGPSWLSGGTVGPEGSIVTLIMLGLVTAWFLAFHRDRRGAPMLIRVEVQEVAQPPL
jgi:CAAX protease family protein